MGDLRERVVGSVLGLALGDALGAPFEFRRREEIPDPLPAFELPWHDYVPGTTTDDTGMARNLIRSLVHAGDVDTVDLADRHIEWYRSQPAGIGNLTRRVLERSDRTGVLAELAARQLWEQRGPEVSAGNGSVMYCAPLGVFRAGRPDLLLEEAPALSAITHWDERCRTACLAVTLAVAALVRGEGPRAAVERALEVVIGREGGEELEYLAAEAGKARPIDGPDMGFTLFTAGIGLQVAAEGVSFEEGLRHVVSLGGDTDTNAAVTGALLGALHGREGLPSAWLEKLVDRRAIGTEAEALANAAIA
ncbi:MAG TPA: ADP-ribosylglycohydrolase family protein [Actinomycetota bacterium]|nr:ADP-ribosylglycohydrolase family protein [Actinomycetota bacterium]